MKNLKYQWSAVYSDGTLVQSNPEDVSTKDPTRSAYYDVDHDRLIAFALSDENNEYLVDLRDGHFEINQAPFKLHSEELSEPLRLIYFHRNQRDFIMGADSLEEKDHRREWHLGWQTTINGENIQKIMRFD